MIASQALVIACGVAIGCGGRASLVPSPPAEKALHDDGGLSPVVHSAGDAGSNVTDASSVGDSDSPRSQSPSTGSSRFTAGFMDEWLAKRELTPEIYPMRDVHLVFDEWFDTGHVRVSVLGDGSYTVEMDGAIRSSGLRHSSSRRRARGFYSGDKGGFAFLRHFGEFGLYRYMMRELGGGPPLPEFPPCPPTGDDGFGSYHAAMTLVLERAVPDMLRSWWTSPQCSGFPHAIARDAWDLVERIAAGSVIRPPWHALSKISPARQGGPDCRGFGGLVHGTSSCVRVDLGTGRIAPRTLRVGGPAAIALACGATLNVAAHAIALACAPDPAQTGTGRVRLSMTIDARPPIVIDTHEGYWDFIHTFVAADQQTLDVTIDYGVLE